MAEAELTVSPVCQADTPVFRVSDTRPHQPRPCQRGLLGIQVRTFSSPLSTGMRKRTSGSRLWYRSRTRFTSSGEGGTAGGWRPVLGAEGEGGHRGGERWWWVRGRGGEDSSF